jgi:membrane-associated HD superfamily phosphohydrolase
MDFYILFSIVWFWAFHYIFDFICQTHWQATNKSKNLDALLNHVYTYSLGMMFVTAGYFSLISSSLFFSSIFVAFVFSMGVFCYFFLTHFFTDLITSKITSKYFKQEDYHMGFVIIGLDQLIHFLTIMIPLFIVIS